MIMKRKSCRIQRRDTRMSSRVNTVLIQRLAVSPPVLHDRFSLQVGHGERDGHFFLPEDFAEQSVVAFYGCCDPVPAYTEQEQAPFSAFPHFF